MYYTDVDACLHTCVHTRTYIAYWRCAITMNILQMRPYTDAHTPLHSHTMLP